jgi:hypothetical protein
MFLQSSINATHKKIYITYASPIPNPTFRNYRAISGTVYIYIYKLDVFI